MGGSRSTARTILIASTLVAASSHAQPVGEEPPLPPPQPQPRPEPKPPPPPSVLHPVPVKQGPPPTPPPLHPPFNRVFFGFAAGTGTGIIGGKTEALRADVQTGFQWSPLHMRVELIALRSPHLGFGITGRLGAVVGADTSPPWAKSVMAKGYWITSSGLRFSGSVGAGYLRYRVGVDGTTKDSMAAGPFLVGASAGWSRPISKSWRVTVDAGVLVGIAVVDKYAGVPNEHALNFDLDVGLVVYR